MKYNFDEIINRTNTASIKWDDVEQLTDGRPAIPFWVADTDFKSPKEVIEALQKRVEHGIFGYTGYTKTIVPTIKKWINNRHEWTVEDEWITYTPGVVSAISYVIDEFTNEGDGILVQTPIYPPFIGVPKENGRKVLENELILVDGKYTIDFEDFEKKAKEAKVFLLSNPHNPSGRVFTKDELIRLGEICLYNNVIIISDEIHSDIIYSGYKHTPIASLNKKLQNITITCYSASKSFSLAGLSTSVIVIPNKNIRDKFNAYLLKKHISVNIMGKVAIEAAYKYGDDYLNQLNEYIESNRDFMLKFMSKNTPKIKPLRGEGTYLVWLDCREMNLSDEKLRDFFTDAGVVLNQGMTFGNAGSGFMRFNIGCPTAILGEGLERIKKAYNNIY
ncbi:pyridoxal phosphate-dependent aminotransferase [Sedimentibacter sp. zth1]|uniref:MalY/PatB family protein n=1 Tax=Sedimentibacter sp. zth1 TaxID=2816908 RepID=UPI001A90CFC0|nr:MalY/PatB family protein [Sedimentibacter sp. zth1]QSX06420.1 pyridoxal phosphate-dependent aminotransferase [Sedimentibacter sp. zth1]